ncbi:hypothetical protein COBT_002723, partial [Conglomerata obtusa]
MYYVPKRHIANNAINRQKIMMPSSGTTNFTTGPVTDTNEPPANKITTEFYINVKRGDIKQISPRDVSKFFHKSEKVLNGNFITNRHNEYNEENDEQLDVYSTETAQKSMDHEMSTFKYFVKKNPIFIYSQIFLFMIFLVLLSLRYEIDLKLFRLCKFCLKAIYKRFCKKDTVKIHTKNKNVSKAVPESNNENLE